MPDRWSSLLKLVHFVMYVSFSRTCLTDRHITNPDVQEAGYYTGVVSVEELRINVTDDSEFITAFELSSTIATVSYLQ